MTNTNTASGAVIPRYKIGYRSDEWGMRSSTPSGIPDHAGAWVRYEDHIAALVDAQQPTPSAGAHKACKPDMLVNGGALKLALNVLRRAGKNEVADELEATAKPSPTPQADSQPAPVSTNYKQALGSTNCMQCCVSYMLGAPMESVPDFATGGGWERFSAFAESKGYATVMIPGNREFEADYLASGKTARGTSHMVVMNDGKLVHDPHPSNAGLTEVQCVWLLAKKATPQRDDREAFEACAKAYTSNVSFERDGDDYEDMTASLLWHGWKLRAARAPADSVTAPAGGVAAGIEAAAKLLERKADDFARENGSDDLGGLSFGRGAHADAKLEYHSTLLELAGEIRSLAPPPPAQAADSVLEDAARLDWLEADESKCVFHLGKSWYTRSSYGMPYRKRASLRAAIDAARKQGANHD